MKKIPEEIIDFILYLYLFIGFYGLFILIYVLILACSFMALKNEVSFSFMDLLMHCL